MRAAANGLNEAGGTARARSAVVARGLGGPGRGPGSGWVAGRRLGPQSAADRQRQRTAVGTERGVRRPPGPPGRLSPNLRLDTTGRRRPAPPGRQDVRLLPHGAAHLARSPRQRCASSPPAARSPRGGWAPRGARAGWSWGAQCGRAVAPARVGAPPGPARGLGSVSAPRALLGSLPSYPCVSPFTCPWLSASHSPLSLRSLCFSG